MKNNDSIFIGMSSGFGPLAQIFPIANELKKQNIEIVCTILRYAGDMIKKLGFTHLELKPSETPPKSIPNTPDWWNQDYYWAKYGYLNYDYVKSIIDKYTEVIEKIKPKAIISALDPPSTAVAWRLGIPLVVITQACEHPQGKGGRTTWWKDLPSDLPNTCPVMNRVLSEIGVKTIERMEYINKGDLTIIPSIPEFDVIECSDVFYTGPMFWQGPDEDSQRDFVLQHNNKYLLFVYTGHLFNSVGRASGFILLDNVIKAFNHTEFDVLISVGTGQKIPDTIKPADNITICDWVPVNRIIPQCDLIMHHGGHGSSLQGLGHGIPSIVIPTTDEREYNARQLAELGVSSFITPGTITPELLLARSRETVGNAGIKEKAGALACSVKERNYNGAAEAAQLIMELMKN